MEIPTWAYDEVLRFSSPSALRVALALYRLDRYVVDNETGGRRAYWKGARRTFCRVAGVSSRSLTEAVRELVEAGLLRVHTKTRANASFAVSVPFDRPEGVAKIATPFEAEDGIAADPSLSSSPVVISDPDSSSTGRERILRELREHGVGGAQQLIADYGVARCAAALEWYRQRVDAGYRVRAPGGFIRVIVTSGGALSGVKSGAELERESRYRKYGPPARIGAGGERVGVALEGGE